MKKNNLKVVKIDKNKSLFNYEKKILIKELTLDLKLGYYDFEKEKPQKVKFSLEIDYEDKKPTSDKDIKSIVNYGQVVKLIKKLTKNKHYNFLETLAEDVFDVLFKDKRIGKIMLQIEKLEILKECTSVGIQITKKSAMSLAPKIRVNGIAPGPTIKNKRQSNKHFKKQYLATPLKKQVDVNEICNAVDFFIKNSSITGQVLAIDSGQNLNWQTPDVIGKE